MQELTMAPRLMSGAPMNLSKVVGNFDEANVSAPRLMAGAPMNLSKVVGNF